MPTGYAYDVFLSHSAQDKGRVRALAERLRSAGITVWYDDWIIKPGDDIYLAIEQGLEQSHVQLLCLSPTALGSDWVGQERSTVLYRDPSNADHRFIPLLLSDCNLPAALRRYKCVDFRQDASAGFDELLARLLEIKTGGVAPRTPEDCHSPCGPRPYVVQDVDDSSALPPQLTNGCAMDFLLIRGGNSIVPDASGGPHTEVGISPFYLGQAPVTNRDFDIFVRQEFNNQLAGLRDRYGENILRHWSGNGLQRSQAKHPVTFVSWRCAIDYGVWLQARYPLTVGLDVGHIQLRYRLPTEAEWETAARGGRSFAIYPWGDDPPDELRLNYDFEQGGTTESKRYPPNSFGLYDMAGNVGEWCLDDFSNMRISAVGTENPCRLSGSESKVIKGGSWRSPEKLVQVSFRDRDGFRFCDEDVGFRIAVEITFQR